MKKVTVLLTTVLTAGMLTACGQGKNAEATSAGVSGVKTETDSVPEAKPERNTITFKLGMTDLDGNNFHKGALAIAEKVNRTTGGGIATQVFAGRQLGNERDMYEGAQMGTIDIFTTSNTVLASFIPEVAVLDQPFLFETVNKAYHVIDGAIGTLVAEKTEEQKIHTVGWMDVGFRNILSTRPVTSLGDMKNLKVHTIENDLHIAAFNAMGTVATPMTSGDVFIGLQQGTIDAAGNAITNLAANRYCEITKNVIRTNHAFSYMGVFMSDKTWNQIPDDSREDFVKDIKAGAQRQRDYLVETNEAAVKELTELGMEFYEIPIDDMRRLVEPVMEQFVDRIDPIQVEAIEAEEQEG